MSSVNYVQLLLKMNRVQAWSNTKLIALDFFDNTYYFTVSSRSSRWPSMPRQSLRRSILIFHWY